MPKNERYLNLYLNFLDMSFLYILIMQRNFFDKLKKLIENSTQYYADKNNENLIANLFQI